MGDILKKVDRVNSVNEASELQDLGVDIIGVSFKDLSIHSEDRTLDIESILQIRQVLRVSDLAIEVPVGYNDILFLVNKTKPNYIQISGNGMLSVEIRKQLEVRGIGIVYSGIEVSYDDDPSWILSSYKDIEALNVSFFQLDLIGNVKNSWEFFKTKLSDYPDALQIEDIVNMGRQFPLMIALDFNKKNVLDIINSFPSIKGISFTLSESFDVSSLHYFSYESTVDVLRTLAKGHG